MRVEKAQRLQNDLGVNLPGVALALQLLDRIDTLEIAPAFGLDASRSPTTPINGLRRRIG